MFETKANIHHLNHMNQTQRNGARIILAMALMAVSNIAISHEISNSYNPGFYHDKPSAPVYKFTGSDGQITYSSSAPADWVKIEKITITSPPSDEYAKDTRQRHDKLKSSAEELAKARLEREAIREEEEKKRLEKLALLNQSKPQQFYGRNVYNDDPYRFGNGYGYGYGYNNHHYPQRPVHLPARGHGGGHRPTITPLPPSSFSPMFHR